MKYLIAACAFAALSWTAQMDAGTEGAVEGRLTIVPGRPVQSAEERPRMSTAANYSDYPLVVLSSEVRQQVARLTAGQDGYYRAALTAGNYVLDVEDRVRKRLHVRAQQFTIVANQTVHVDMTIDTGFAAEGSAPQE